LLAFTLLYLYANTIFNVQYIILWNQMICIFSFEIHKYIFRLVQDLYTHYTIYYYILCIVCSFSVSRIAHRTISSSCKIFYCPCSADCCHGKIVFHHFPTLSDTAAAHRHRSGVFLEGTRLTPTRVSRGNTTSDHWPPPSPPGPRDIN